MYNWEWTGRMNAKSWLKFESYVGTNLGHSQTEKQFLYSIWVSMWKDKESWNAKIHT